MKNQNLKIESKESKKENIDSLNLENVKINLSKNSDLLTKESKNFNRKEIYKGMQELSTDEKKKFRNKIRSKTKYFVNQILGKDRSEKERTDSIKEFLTFYKENWKIQDFKIESFTSKQNESDLKDLRNLLKYVSESLG